MTNKQWDYVMVTNSLLHGMYLDPASHTFQKARYPGTRALITQVTRLTKLNLLLSAFKLKASFPDPLDTDPKSKAKSDPKSKTASDPKAIAANDAKSKTASDPESKAKGDPESKPKSDSESKAENEQVSYLN
jgi:hypothetical protein